MFSVSVDKTGNKLTITLKAQFNLQDAKQLYAQVQEIVPKLEKGFILLTDMTLLEHMDLNIKSSIEKTMDLINKQGVSKIIRIIPDQKKDIGFSIMSLFHYSTEVPIHTYKSYQQAAEHFK